MEKKIACVFGFLIGSLAAIMFYVSTGLWLSYVTWTLWGWFAVPLLELPTLSIWAIWGLRITWNTATYFKVNIKGEEPDTKASLVSLVAIPLMALSAGYIIKGWI
jgi:hypothetical protein